MEDKINMKRIGMIFMMTTIATSMIAIAPEPRVTEQRTLARGQPDIGETFVFVITDCVEGIEVAVIDSEVSKTEKPGIMVRSSEEKNEMVLCTGDRKVRDVDSCNVPEYT